MDNPITRFNIGMAGFFDDSQKYIIASKITDIFQTIKKCVDSKLEHSDSVSIDIYASPLFTDEALADLRCDSVTFNAVMPKEYENIYALGKCNSSVTIDIPSETLQTFDNMAAYIAGNIDLGIIIWDGNQLAYNGYIWRFIEQCKKNYKPVVRINLNTPNELYWYSDEYSYENYTPEKLTDYISGILITEVKEIKIKETLLSKYRKWLYKRYQKKNSAEWKDWKPDILLEPDFKYAYKNDNQKKNSSMMYYAFHKHDDKAVELGNYHRDAIYYRSIIPIWVTIFIAIGFYIETLLGIFNKFERTFNPLYIAAGTGFLLSAAITLYIFFLSENKNIKNYKKSFIKNRYIAEYLRVTVHFLTFGIPVKTKKISSEIKKGKNNKIDRALELRHILRGITPADYSLNKNVYKDVIRYLQLFSENQKEYQKYVAKRYNKMEKSLEKLGRIFLWISVIFILLRALIQFALPFLGGITWLTVKFAGNDSISHESFIRSLANCIALLLPAVASFFSTKRSLNNFSVLKEHYYNMAGQWEIINTKIKKLEEIPENLSYEIIHLLSGDIMAAVMDDIDKWCTEMDSKNIERL